MKNIRAVIFDLDGVLCSTDKYHYAAWKKLADRLGIPFDVSMNDKLRGVSRMESLDLMLGDSKDAYSLEEKQQFSEEKNATYRAMLDGIKSEDLSTDVYNTLVKLKESGIRLAVGSSSKNARIILDKLGLTNLFDAIADGTQIKNSKPDPEVFLLAAKLLNVSPREAIVVEDAESGIAAAKAGGFYAVGLNVDGNMRISSLKELDGLVGV